MLEITHLVGGYTQEPVLKDVTMTVPSGQLVALVGLNGAGKSTLIKHIMGLMTPFSGQITVAQRSLLQDEQAYRQAIAFVPETPTLYEELTLREHLELTAQAYQVPVAEAMKEAMRYLEAFRLADKLEWFPAYFSKGMKQKVMLVCAFLVPAKLYIIDEPFLGLDPLAIHHLLAFIDEKKAAGATVLMSTHVLATAEQRSDQVVLLHDGQVVAQGTLAELQAQFQLPQATLDDVYVAMVTRAEAAAEVGVR